MNDYGFIDYKKPLGPQDDMRTSSYRGHVYMTDTQLGNHLDAKFAESRKTYTQDPVLAKACVSDYKANYEWKFGEPSNPRNPTLDRKVLFIKPFDECKMRFIKRPLRPASSVSHQDYLWHPEAPKELPPPLPMPTAVQTTRIIIDRSKPGFAKYLDPGATTTRLDYTPHQLIGGLAERDNITFWNWTEKSNVSKRVFPERDAQMCDYMAAKECPKRRCEFPSMVKHVPHSGLSTEVRENYLEPHKRAVDFDITHVRNELVNFPIVPFAKKTEAKLYGSGERTQKYV